MKRLIFILIISYVFFILEWLGFGLAGRWLKPNLMVIFIVFLGLYLGIRYSILAACIGGLIKDVFSLEILGTHMFALILAAYLAVFIRKHYYQPGNILSRIFIVVMTTVGYVLVLSILKVMDQEIALGDIFRFILLPEVMTTALVTAFVFDRLKSLALRFAI